MPETLLPCPFCGSEAVKHATDPECPTTRLEWIKCIDCLAEGPFISGSSLDTPAAAWNRRHSPTSPGDTGTLGSR